MDGASEYYVNNPYEPDSDYSFMLAGGRARMSALSGYFLQKGVTFPELTEWKFHGLELKGTEAQGKRRRAEDDNGYEPSAASSGNPPSKAPRTATVAAALRHRLAKAEPAGGHACQDRGGGKGGSYTAFAEAHIGEHVMAFSVLL